VFLFEETLPITSVPILRYLDAILKKCRPTYDLINMPERSDEEKNRGGKERRRAPRFNCGGYVQLNWLPSNGIYVPGKVRDLGLYGCCIDTNALIDSGMRAEIVVRVKTNSFRAVGEIKGIRGASGLGMEFVRLSAGGKGLLEDLVRELARLQAAIDKLKTAGGKSDPELFRSERNYRRLQAEMLSMRFPYLETLAPEESSEQDPSASADKGQIVEKQPLVIPVDLYG
jgi:hypothetical protein